MIYIDTNQVRKAASYDEWIDAMEQALTLREDADFIMPQRSHIDFGDKTLLLMPCITKEYISTKLVSMFPGNRDKGLPPILGTVILSSGETGEQLAAIEGASLTAMRTAAVGSVAVRHLAQPGAKCLGIIGAGTQGLHQALFACSQRKIDKLVLLDNKKEACERFMDLFSAEYPGVSIEIGKDNEDLVEKSDIIISATNSTVPVLPDKEGLYHDKLIIGIGSYKPGMREFPDALFSVANEIYIDTKHGITESGDLIYPVEKGYLKKQQLIAAGEILKKEIGLGGLKVFKSVGMALFDNAAAKLVWGKVTLNKNDPNV